MASHRQASTWIIATVLAVLLAACTSESPLSVTTADQAVSGGVGIVADEYRFIPATLTLGAGETVRLRNEGGLAHTWTVLSSPIDSESELPAATKLAEGRVEVGQVVEIDVSSIGAGTYQVVCAIPGHFSQGMHGDLVVAGG